MDGPRPNPRGGMESKQKREKQRGNYTNVLSGRQIKNVERAEGRGEFQVSRLINQWYRGSYTAAFLAGKQIWDAVLFRSKDQEVLIRQECMFLHQPKTRRFQLEN